MVVILELNYHCHKIIKLLTIIVKFMLMQIVWYKIMGRNWERRRTAVIGRDLTVCHR
jgi:hypothetical protein